MTDTQVQELLKPRYKVIADYPASDFLVGDIFTFDDYESYDTPYDTKNGVFLNTVGKYPHLFKRLEWWEEMATDEMPEYLKSVKRGHYIQVAQWEGFNVNNVPLFEFRISTQHPWVRGLASEWTPATEEEYLSFINQTNSK